ncbi:DUF4176 domain-containing protein [Ligilactobacillus pobuzihii]|uniref:DUF4176 domain-containing protein n=1 Tax=Ligilactobacillus pobuzihii TaxID=449659 RepID=A0A0R2LCA1_9LACO|nr:DUF4176 domain-containing protein [Ligilactobacillus pobuzihii]KRK08962.1 hypothetical protein FD11_GL001628 [Ligilactobacillus pobuzihii E100301 = KCTC 13174]KRN99599.1 hypothetical protein IV66_GL001605 [Ligilactobacillus pobuzihii]GEN48303.1 hypothetical protein LPO01_10950 [Ligilactobacillus pobuzihii]
MTEKKNTLLPLGSIVYLEEGTVKLMVVGRGAVFNDDGDDKYSDYVGVEYPSGIDPENALFFNNDDIDKIVFRGYEDDEEERYLEVYQNWEKNLDIPKKSN